MVGEDYFKRDHIFYFWLSHIPSISTFKCGINIPIYPTTWNKLSRQGIVLCRMFDWQGEISSGNNYIWANMKVGHQLKVVWVYIKHQLGAQFLSLSPGMCPKLAVLQGSYWALFKHPAILLEITDDIDGLVYGWRSERWRPPFSCTDPHNKNAAIITACGELVVHGGGPLLTRWSRPYSAHSEVGINPCSDFKL